MTAENPRDHCLPDHGTCRLNCRAIRLPWVILYVFAATALFSGSFAVAYPGGSQFMRWGIVIGAAAAVSWPFFIGLLASATPLDLFGALKACVYTMAVGNTILLASVVINLAARAASWVPPFSTHVAIISSANLGMLITLHRLTCTILPLPRLMAFWFLGLNGIFAIIVLLAYEVYIK